MASFLDKLKGAFIEYKDVPDDKPVEGQPVTPVPTPSPVAPSTQVAGPVVDQALVKSFDESARKTLIESIGASGAHLVEELSDLLETLKENIPDEGALFKAALKVLGKKHSATEILGDFDKCLGVIEQKDREFEAQLKAQFDKRVGSKVQQVKEFESQIDAKKAQLAQLQAEMADLAVKAQETKGSVAEEQSKLDLAQDRFSRTYKIIRAEIESQRAKVAQYGGTV